MIATIAQQNAAARRTVRRFLVKHSQGTATDFEAWDAKVAMDMLVPPKPKVEHDFALTEKEIKQATLEKAKRILANASNVPGGMTKEEEEAQSYIVSSYLEDYDEYPTEEDEI